LWENAWPTIGEIPAAFGRLMQCSTSSRARHRGAWSRRTCDAVELIGGDLPARQRRLVEAWAEIHQRELLDDWERLQAGRPPVKIEPLR
jgi:hypothetical protein